MIGRRRVEWILLGAIGLTGLVPSTVTLHGETLEGSEQGQAGNEEDNAGAEDGQFGLPPVQVAGPASDPEDDFQVPAGLGGPVGGGSGGFPALDPPGNPGQPGSFEPPGSSGGSGPGANAPPLWGGPPAGSGVSPGESPRFAGLPGLEGDSPAPGANGGGPPPPGSFGPLPGMPPEQRPPGPRPLEPSMGGGQPPGQPGGPSPETRRQDDGQPRPPLDLPRQTPPGEGQPFPSWEAMPPSGMTPSAGAGALPPGRTPPGEPSAGPSPGAGRGQPVPSPVPETPTASDEPTTTMPTAVAIVEAIYRDLATADAPAKSGDGIAPESGETRPGSLSLFEATGRVSDRAGRRTVIEDYWQASLAWADHVLAETDREFWQGLHQAASRRGGGPEPDTIATEGLTAEARVHETSIALTQARYRLAESSQATLPPGTLPLPVDPPFVGPYATKFSQLFPGGRAPDTFREMNAVLPQLAQLVEARALAWQAAETSRDRALDAWQAGRGSVWDVIAAHDRLMAGRIAFLAAVRDYNLTIANYSLSVATGPLDRRTVVAMLIGGSRVPASRSFAEDRPLTTLAQDGTAWNGSAGSLPLAGHSVLVPSDSSDIRPVAGVAETRPTLAPLPSTGGFGPR